MICNIKSGKFWPYYIRILNNRRIFAKLLEKAECETDINKRLDIAQIAANFAAFNQVGQYSCMRLENIFCQAARSFDVGEPERVHPNSFLHVFTCAHSVGGHTRVAERWMNNSPKEEMHSVVIIDKEKSSIPQWLQDAVQYHNGEFITLPTGNVIEHARELRVIASKYERIILHIHMNDGTALVAFGTLSFRRPIIFYNHADHMFWLGVSIADIVADLRSDNFVKRRRGATNVEWLGIPTTGSKGVIPTYGNKFDLRKELDIPQDKHILITVGDEFKYNDVGTESFRHLMELCLKNEEAILYCIGISGISKKWKRSMSRAKGKIVTLGKISDRTLYYKYLQASDLYVGSFPMEGLTAQMDAIECGLPVLNYYVSKQEDFRLGCMEGLLGNGVCSTHKEFLKKCWTLMYNSDKREILYSEQIKNLHKMSNECWRNRLLQVYTHCPNMHTVCSFNDNIVVDDMAVVLQSLYSNLSIPVSSKGAILFVVIDKLLRGLRYYVEGLFTRNDNGKSKRQL